MGYRLMHSGEAAQAFEAFTACRKQPSFFSLRLKIDPTAHS
jgi:hypothetical protein